MGYWQENGQKRRLWFDPVDNRWRRDGSKWIPTKKAKNTSQLPVPEPPYVPALGIKSAFGNRICGYQGRLNQWNIYPSNKTIGAAVDEIDAYNAYMPLKHDFPSTPIGNEGDYGPVTWNVTWPGPGWTTAGNATFPARTFEATRDSVNNWSNASPYNITGCATMFWSQNFPGQYYPLGHQTTMNNWDVNDPQHNDTNALRWDEGPMLIWSWERVSQLAPPPDFDLITIQAECTWTNPLDSNDVRQIYSQLPIKWWSIPYTSPGIPKYPPKGDAGFFKFHIFGTNQNGEQRQADWSPSGGWDQMDPDYWIAPFKKFQTFQNTTAAIEHSWDWNDTYNEVFAHTISVQYGGDISGGFKFLTETDLVTQNFLTNNNKLIWPFTDPTYDFVEFTHRIDGRTSCGQIVRGEFRVRYERANGNWVTIEKTIPFPAGPDQIFSTSTEYTMTVPGYNYAVQPASSSPFDQEFQVPGVHNFRFDNTGSPYYEIIAIPQEPSDTHFLFKYTITQENAPYPPLDNSFQVVPMEQTFPNAHGLALSSAGQQTLGRYTDLTRTKLNYTCGASPPSDKGPYPRLRWCQKILDWDAEKTNLFKATLNTSNSGTNLAPVVMRLLVDETDVGTVDQSGAYPDFYLTPSSANLSAMSGTALADPGWHSFDILFQLSANDGFECTQMEFYRSTSTTTTYRTARDLHYSNEDAVDPDTIHQQGPSTEPPVGTLVGSSYLDKWVTYRIPRSSEQITASIRLLFVSKIQFQVNGQTPINTDVEGWKGNDGTNAASYCCNFLRPTQIDVTDPNWYQVRIKGITNESRLSGFMWENDPTL